MKTKLYYYYYTLAAAATTAIAGILHLTLVPNAINFNINNAVFFLVAGIAQIFWALPMIKRWGRTWYVTGIIGTAILIIIWVITRIPDNPITGRGGPISEMAVAIEVLQIAYIVMTAIIMAKERAGKPHCSDQSVAKSCMDFYSIVSLNGDLRANTSKTNQGTN